jgi:hypothetical protein
MGGTSLGFPGNMCPHRNPQFRLELPDHIRQMLEDPAHPVHVERALIGITFEHTSLAKTEKSLMKVARALIQKYKGSKISKDKGLG